MKKWGKKYSLAALLSAGLLMMAPAAANAAYDSCNSSAPCGWNVCDMQFDAGVDFLWWKPCIDQLEYAAVVKGKSDTLQIDYKNVCLDWEPGVRVWAYIPSFYCDFGLCASYTFIESNSSSSVKDESDVTSPLVHIGTDESEVTQSTNHLWDHAKGDYQLTYHEWDVCLAHDISWQQCHHFKPFFGVAGLVMDQELKVTLREQEEKDSIHWNSDYWGVGFRAGSVYKYRMNDCLSFFAKAYGTILAGSADNSNKQYFRDDVQIKDDENCHVLPGYHIGAGFVYDTCWCNWDFSARLGYEFLVWHNVPNHRVYTNSNEGAEGLASHATSSSTRTLAFHGLFAGLGLSF